MQPLSVRQEQKAGDNATAIQAGGDVNVGVPLAEIATIMQQLLDANAQQIGIAWQKSERRTQEFCERIFEKFAPGKAGANSEAFRDPGFLLLLPEAQKSHVRAGEPTVLANLVELIARRSMETDRTELTASLEDAAAVCASLTPSSFAILSTVLLLKRSRFQAKSLDAAIEALSPLSLLLPQINNKYSSFNHLISNSCATLSVLSFYLLAILGDQLAGVLNQGADTAETLLAALPAEKKNALIEAGLIGPCLNNRSKVQLTITDVEHFSEWLKEHQIHLADDERNAVWMTFRSTIGTMEDVSRLISPRLAVFPVLIDLWSGPLQKVELTTLGITIAHTNLKRINGNLGDLASWFS